MPTKVSSAPSAPEPADFLSAFDALLSASKDSNVRTKVSETFLDKLSEEIKVAFNFAEISYASPVTLIREGDSRKPELNRPISLKPRGGRFGDNFASERNKARTLFVNCLISLAAQNQGKIALIDVAALHIAFNLKQYNSAQSNDLLSIAQITGALFNRLNRSIKTDDNWLEIIGLKEDPDLKGWVRPANLAIASGKHQIASR